MKTRLLLLTPLTVLGLAPLLHAATTPLPPEEKTAPVNGPH